MNKDKSKESSKIDHDKTAKKGLQNKEWFKAILRYKLPKDLYDAIDFSRFEYVDTGLLSKKDDVLREFRADSVAKIGVKDMDTDGLFSIITEHKSAIESEEKLFLQVHKYQNALLDKGLYTLFTLIIVHGKGPAKLSPDLQSALGWSSKIKKKFGPYASNFAPFVIDLYEETEQDIRDRGDVASPWMFALKHVWNMTADRFKSLIELCCRYSKGKQDYFRKFDFLMEYALKASRFSIKNFKEIEDDVFQENKEGQTMPSTYDMLIDEGLQKGLQQGLQQGRQEGQQEGREAERRNVALNLLKRDVDPKLILDSTGLSETELEDLKNKQK